MNNEIMSKITVTKKIYITKKPLFIGDIHGMYDELVNLLESIDFKWVDGQLISDTYEIISIGDLIDRGKNSVKVLQMKLKHAVIGNHDWKIIKYLHGHDIKIQHGTETTVKELENLSEEQKLDILNYYLELPLQLIINDKYLAVHGGMKNEHLNAPFKYAMYSNLFGCPRHDSKTNGRPERGQWWKDYTLPYTCVYGHTPVKDIYIYGNTVNIDTGAVFGGMLTAYDPEDDIVYQLKCEKPDTNTSSTEFQWYT